MIPVDLHMHSCYSNDGEFTVSELIRKCKEKEIFTFSITDHNSAQANKAAAELAESNDMKYIPGIEIDCIYKGINLHVLGYNIEWRSPVFSELEKDVSVKVMDSFNKMIENVLALGFKVDKEDVLHHANGILPSAELIAEVMLGNEKYYTPLLKPYMKGGERSDMPYINFYLDYFAQGKPAFVPIEYISYAEAIELITTTGGIPVVAHPGLNLRGCEHIARELLDEGAFGLEVFNNYHSEEQIAYFSNIVRQTETLMTCGSDFHGKTKPLISIGQYKYRETDKLYLQESIAKIQEASPIT